MANSETETSIRKAAVIALITERRWETALLIGLAGYLVLIQKLDRIRPDQVFVLLAILAFLSLGKRWGRLFLLDWAPFIAFWLAYDMMRGLAVGAHRYIHIIEPYQWEATLFGWLTPAAVPAFYLHELQNRYAGTLLRKALDLFSAQTYMVHFLAPAALGWFLWHVRAERRSFYLFAYAFTVLNCLALTTFFLYPAAPPWYVLNNGFGQPTGRLLGSAGALVNFDRLIETHWVSTFWNTFNTNFFAAIPSLHAGYPTLIALVLCWRFGRKAWLAFLYPTAAWFSAVYLGHHYIVDLILGSAYALLAFVIAERLLLPKVLDRIVDYEQTSRRWLAGEAELEGEG
jgi:inositol phosphorylceramide synthase catalytic subunit